MKTKEELLKIYSSYLPYELKFISYMDVPFDEMATNPIWTLDGINKMFGDYCLLTKENSDAYSSATCKPLLFSMDYLTKEIEHKGERFVPIEKLSEMFNFDFDGDGFQITDDLTIIYNSYSETEGFMFPSNFWLDFYQKLFEWHFNVFGLSDSEYIKKETLK